MSALIPIGTAATGFSDITVTASTPQQAWIIDSGVDAPTSSGPVYQVAYKTSLNNYLVIGTITVQNQSTAGYFNRPGVYGVRRMATGHSSGLDVA